MKMLEISWGSETKKVIAMKQGRKLWAHIDGEVICYEAKGSSANQSKAAFTFGPLKSPMPGKIMKVNIKVGDVIEAKKTLIVLEAMKMEYSIKVPESSKVTKVLCAAGDQVKEGQVLLEVEKV